MSSYGGFPAYVPVAEKRKRAEESVKKLKKKNPDISPVVIEGKTIATTWWGKSWNKNLESYADYANRIARGRSYVKNGAVLDLKITEGNINALVQGSGSKPYKVDISIKALPKNIWEDLINQCLGKIESIEELIEGKFPKALADLFTVKGRGLFPSPDEIDLSCSCPDWATMCKHVAAVLYGVGARLDDKPELFFILRKVNINDLISEAINKKTQTLLEKSKVKGRRVIEETDMFDMFGIDMEVQAEDKVKKRKSRKTSLEVDNTKELKKSDVKETKVKKTKKEDEIKEIKTKEKTKEKNKSENKFMKWEIHSEQDERIYNIIKDIRENDDMKALEAWESHLNYKLKFPFEAEVMDSYCNGIETGDKLRVHGIEMISDDLHGIIVNSRKGRKKYSFELCLLDVVSSDDETKMLVDDYGVWFSNR